MMDRDFVVRSKTYLNVLKHRLDCSNWKNKILCIECFGGGLTKYTEDLFREYENSEEK